MADSAQTVSRKALVATVIAGTLIVAGLAWSVRDLVAERRNARMCADCLTASDDGRSLKVRAGEAVRIKLSSSLYPADGLSISSRPEGSAIAEGSARQDSGYWVRTVRAARPGTADIYAKSSLPTLSDFHIVIVAE